MRITFSRKGFDAANGGIPSPIFPDGKLCYLPIPSDRERLKYEQIVWERQSLGSIVDGITGGRLGPKSAVHLDPDINPNALKRQPGWKGLFGQTGAAQSHLANCGVTRGDVFLFFGWFREVRLDQGRIVHIAHARNLHVLFGWMQVGSVRKVGEVGKQELRWARYHPHFDRDRAGDGLNTVYVAARKLVLPGLSHALPGAGVFRTFKEHLCLTAPESSRSRWRLPKWFYPSSSDWALSYHGDLSRWSRGKDCVYLRTVGRGQEFVLDCDHYPEAIAWLTHLLKRA